MKKECLVQVVCFRCKYQGELGEPIMKAQPIKFLGDCTHDLVNKEVPLEDVDASFFEIKED